MEKLRRLLSRIRWVSVIALLFLLIVVAMVLTSIPSKYRVQGNIGLSAKASPGSINVGDISSVEIEVKNLDKYDRKTVNVEAKTYDDRFVFVKTGSREIVEKDVKIGPQEIRKIEFDVRATSGARQGRYRIDIEVVENTYSVGAEDKVYIEVVED